MNKLTPEQKAIELYEQHYDILDDLFDSVPWNATLEQCAKRSAIFTVEEIMKAVPRYEYGQGEKHDSVDYEYWSEVKLKLEKL